MLISILAVVLPVEIVILRPPLWAEMLEVNLFSPLNVLVPVKRVSPDRFVPSPKNADAVMLDADVNCPASRKVMLLLAERFACEERYIPLAGWRAATLETVSVSVLIVLASAGCAIRKNAPMKLIVISTL